MLTNEKREKIASRYTEAEIMKIMRLVDKYELLDFVANVYADMHILMDCVNETEFLRSENEALLALMRLRNIVDDMYDEEFKIGICDHNCDNCPIKEDCIVRSIKKASKNSGHH